MGDEDDSSIRASVDFGSLKSDTPSERCRSSMLLFSSGIILSLLSSYDNTIMYNTIHENRTTMAQQLLVYRFDDRDIFRSSYIISDDVILKSPLSLDCNN